MSDPLVLGIIWYGVFLASTTVHEAAHAFAAWRFGDPTAFEGGQVSLNPIPHLKREPFGMLVLPWLSFAAYGWMMGWASAPYDPYWADRYPRKAALMGLSGPFANLSLVILAGILIHVGISAGLFYPPDSLKLPDVVEAHAAGVPELLALMVSILFTLNLLLFIFNMIPLPPLDGVAWLELLLSPEAVYKFRMMTRMNPAVRLIGLFGAWYLIGIIFSPLYTLALNALYVFRGISYGSAY